MHGAGNVRAKPGGVGRLVARDQDDFINIHTTTRRAPDAEFTDVWQAALALEDLQVQHEKACFEAAQQRFRLVGTRASV